MAITAITVQSRMNDRSVTEVMSMVNRFNALTDEDEDLDHALGMCRSALARRGREAKGWKRLAFDLIWAAGGTQRISMSTAMSAHSEDTLEFHHDQAADEMVYRVYRPSHSDAAAEPPP